MKKKNIVITVCILIGFALVIGFCFSIYANRPKTFSEAKALCEKFLEKNRADMEAIATDALNSQTDISGHYKKHYYSYNSDERLVTFDIGAQGMLGGQYWNLAYSEDGTLYGETEEYIYKETNGNNIVRAKRINKNWWYIWTDYDGTKKSYQ